MDWIFRLLVRWLPSTVIQRRYVLAGGDAGDSISYIGAGCDTGLIAKTRRWAWWEREYARRGFKPLSTHVFIDFGGYGIPLTGLGERQRPSRYVHYFAAAALAELLKNEGVPTE